MARPTFAELRVRPTPQTLAHLQPDHVQALLAERRLSHEQAQACAEIRDVYEALHGATGGLTESRGGRFAEPLSRLPVAIERLWRERYRPWSSSLASLGHAGQAELAMTIDLAVQNLALPAIATLRAVRPKAALILIRDALDHYLDLARRIRGA